ncbi:MAG: STAS domain-containing protein [Nannocystis sp.]|nr:STAS domain-containing protein [Nannocystis sp.]MBA3546980.1 STAS domain-containing protein [Nannocystis sp.]
MAIEDEGAAGAAASVGDGASRRVLAAFAARAEYSVTVSVDRVLAAKIPFYTGLPREVVAAAIRRVYATVEQDLELGQPRAFPAFLAALGTQRSAQGVAVSEILSGMNIGFEAVSEDFDVYFADDPEAHVYWERSRARIAYGGVSALADAYLSAREKVMRAQADEILRLSTQVLPVHRGILLFPLVGTIDAARAQAILEVLLAVVSRHNAKVVLVDVSGVPVLDAEAGAYLSRTAQAVRLLGARAILVGTSAAVARTMIAAGVDLGSLKTLADLESGLQYALSLIGRQIVAR